MTNPKRKSKSKKALFIIILILISCLTPKVISEYKEYKDRKLIAKYYGKEFTNKLDDDFLGRYVIIAEMKDVRNKIVEQRKSFSRAKDILKSINLNPDWDIEKLKENEEYIDSSIKDVEELTNKRR